MNESKSSATEAVSEQKPIQQQETAVKSNDVEHVDVINVEVKSKCGAMEVDNEKEPIQQQETIVNSNDLVHVDVVNVDVNSLKAKEQALRLKKKELKAKKAKLIEFQKQFESQKQEWQAAVTLKEQSLNNVEKGLEERARVLEDREKKVKSTEKQQNKKEVALKGMEDEIELRIAKYVVDKNQLDAREAEFIKNSSNSSKRGKKGGGSSSGENTTENDILASDMGVCMMSSKMFDQEEVMQFVPKLRSLHIATQKHLCAIKKEEVVERLALQIEMSEFQAPKFIQFWEELRSSKESAA